MPTLVPLATLLDQHPVSYRSAPARTIILRRSWFDCVGQGRSGKPRIITRKPSHRRDDDSESEHSRMRMPRGQVLRKDVDELSQLLGVQCGIWPREVLAVPIRAASGIIQEANFVFPGKRQVLVPVAKVLGLF